MKTYEQSIKTENVDLTGSVSEARNQVARGQMDRATAEEEVRSLEIELKEAQEAARGKEEAERKGKETKEKINEAVA